MITMSVTRYMNERAKTGYAYVPTNVEHIANMVTHGFIITPSIMGMLWLIHLSVTPDHFWVAIIYGSALIALFTTSSTFHLISYCQCGSVRNVFHIGDRAVIYIFIAASYTPWLTLRTDGVWSTTLLCAVWFMAIAGVMYQYIFHEKFKSLETILYVIIGLSPAIAILSVMDHSDLHELAFGGCFYIVGVVFFKCDGIIPFAHAIWHCFVTLGATCQFFAVAKYLYKCPTLGAYFNTTVRVEL